MKAILLLFVALNFFEFSAAQISKGNWLVGGDISYINSKPRADTYTGYAMKEFNASINGGYFFFKKFAAGLRTSMHISKTKFNQSNNTTTVFSQSTKGVGPLLRYYVLSPEKIVNVFADAGFLYNIGARESFGYRPKTIYTSFGAGVVVFLNSNIGLEGLATYEDFRHVNSDDSGTRVLQGKVGVQLHFGKSRDVNK